MNGVDIKYIRTPNLSVRYHFIDNPYFISENVNLSNMFKEWIITQVHIFWRSSFYTPYLFVLSLAQLLWNFISYQNNFEFNAEKWHHAVSSDVSKCDPKVSEINPRLTLLLYTFWLIYYQYWSINCLERFTFLREIRQICFKNFQEFRWHPELLRN